MNSPMSKPSVIAIQYGGVVVAIACAVVALWGFHSGWLNIGWVITLAYTECCALAVGFGAWYCRWYLSDEFVTRTAKKAAGLDPGFVDAVVEHHPRREDIRREIERQASQ